MGDRKRIGWFCSYVPEELIMASGLEPVRLRGQVGELKEVDSYLFSNICPYLKNILDSGLRGRLGLPTLNLEGDMADERNYSPERTMSKLSSFIEILISP